MTVIRRLSQKFRRHETWCSNICCIESLAILSSEGTDKAEVNNFYIKVFGEQDILWLYITMSEALAVQVVNTL